MTDILDSLLQQMPVDCRKATRRAVLMCAKSDTIDSADAREAIEALVLAVHRTQQRRTSDRRTDFCRRRLAGARVPITDYIRFSDAAERKGLSLYRWIYNALLAAAIKQENEEKTSFPTTPERT